MIEEFAQIVGLLSAFSAGRDGSKAKELAEFNQWLIEHKHLSVLEEIKNSSSTVVFVKAFLNRELPGIQSKLDVLTAMVQILIRNKNESEEDVRPGNLHYAKNGLILQLQRDVAGNYSLGDFDEVLEYVEQFFHSETIHYNRYVLREIVRECLELKGTAYEIVNKHWGALCQ